MDKSPSLPLSQGSLDSGSDQPQRLAVFDVDGTLYRANTLYDFLERYFAKRSVRKWMVFRTARTFPGKVAWTVINKVAGRDVLRQMAFRSFRGEPEREVCSAADAYVTGVLPRSVLSAPTSLLQSAKADGYYVLLVSGTASPIAQAVARSLDADGWLAAEIGLEAGACTGTIASDVLGRKLDAVRQAYPGSFVRVVVTDNRDDIELVRAASEASVVARTGRHARWWEARDLPHVTVLDPS